MHLKHVYCMENWKVRIVQNTYWHGCEVLVWMFTNIKFKCSPGILFEEIFCGVLVYTRHFLDSGKAMLHKLVQVTDEGTNEAPLRYIVQWINLWQQIPEKRQSAFEWISTWNQKSCSNGNIVKYPYENEYSVEPYLE